MKKTITANIAGLVFNIEEEAYQILLEYLDLIRANFKNEEERVEIMADIEARIAELFSNKTNENVEAIGVKDVQGVVEIMGTPEDYVTEEDEESQSDPSGDEYTEYFSGNKNKRIYKNPDDAKVFGVCSGIANYLEWDPTIIRVLFVILVLLGGSGVLIYLILFFVLPDAKTTSEKLHMKGEKINVENIKQHFYSSKEKMEQGGKKFSRKMNAAVAKSKNTTSQIGNILKMIIGIGFLIFGVLLSIVLFVLFFGDAGILPIWSNPDSLSLSEFNSIVFSSSFQTFMAVTGILLVLVIPIAWLLFVGIRLVFNVKLKSKGFAIASTSLFVLGAGLCFLAGITLALQYQDYGKVEYAYQLPNNDADTLYLKVDTDPYFSDYVTYGDDNLLELIKMDDEIFHVGYPKLRIVQTALDSVFSVEVTKSSQGKTQTDAILKAENFAYEIASSENHVVFDPYFSAYKNDKWRDQRVVVTVKVPVGKTVHLSKNLTRIMYDVHNVNNVYDGEMTNKYWTMESEGLDCIGCIEKLPYISKSIK